MRDQALRELRGSRTLRLAAVTTAGEYIVPPLLMAFRQSRPEVEITLEVGNRVRIFERLLRREADIAIGGRPPAGTPIEGTPFIDHRRPPTPAGCRPRGFRGFESTQPRGASGGTTGSRR